MSLPHDIQGTETAPYRYLECQRVGEVFDSVVVDRMRHQRQVEAVQSPVLNSAEGRQGRERGTSHKKNTWIR